MDRKRWIILAAGLGCGLLILADRWWSEPSPAVANPGSPRTNSRAAVSGKGHKPAAPAAAKRAELVDPSLAYLDTIQSGPGTRDIFAPSPSVTGMYASAAESERSKEASAKGLKPGSREAFQAEYHLQATFTGPDAIAVVNGKPLRVGEAIGGYRLTRVHPYAADFNRGKSTVRLSIPSIPAR